MSDRKGRPDGETAAVLRSGAVLTLLLLLGGMPSVRAQDPWAETPAKARRRVVQQAATRQYLPPAPLVHPVMKGDERLSRKVTVAIADASIADLLAELAKQIDVPLNAAQDVAEDAVTAGFSERPASHVLALLSTHLGFTWRKKGKGYQLWQDLPSRRRERTLREQLNWSLINRCIEIGRVVRRTTREWRANRLTELRRRIGGRPHGPEADPLLAREYENLAEVRDREGPALAAFSLLPRADLERLASTGSIRLSTVDRTMDSAAIAELQRQNLLERSRDRRGNLTEEVTGWELKLHIEDEAKHKFLATTINGFGPGVALDGHATVPLPLPEEGYSQVGHDPRLDHRIPQIERRARRKLTSGPALFQWMQDQSKWPDVPTLGEFLIATHRVCGLDVLADSFAFQRLRRAAAVLQDEDPVWADSSLAKNLLHLVERELRVVALIGDGLVRVRSRDYAAARLRSVPPSAIRAGLVRLQADPSCFLDLLGELADRLRPEQQVELIKEWGYLWENDQWFLPSISGESGGEPLFTAGLVRRLGPEHRPLVAGKARVRLDALSAAAQAAILRRVSHPPLWARPVPPDAGHPNAIEITRSSSLTAMYFAYDDSGREVNRVRVDVRPGEPHQPPADVPGRRHEQIGEPTQFTGTSFQLYYQGGHSSYLGGVFYRLPVRLPPLPAPPRVATPAAP